MSRKMLPLFCAVLAVALGWGAPSLAQESAVEVSAGASFGLLSQELSLEEDTSWNLQVSYLPSRKFSFGLVYESLESIDNLERIGPGGNGLVEGDATLELYGISGIFVLTGDPEFEVFAVASAGRGSLTYDNPLPVEGNLVNDTDIDLWYEIGGGSRFALGEHWNLRIQLTFRRISPHLPSVLLEQSQGAVYPSFFVSRRF